MARSLYCGMPVATDTSRIPRVPRASLHHALSELPPDDVCAVIERVGGQIRERIDERSAQLTVEQLDIVGGENGCAVPRQLPFQSRERGGWSYARRRRVVAPAASPRATDPESSPRWRETRSLEFGLPRAR